MLQLRDNSARPDIEIPPSKQNRPRMLIKITKRERATVLAALRRWLSHPAATEADFIATNGGKHKPLDNGEIDRLCKRITGLERKRDGEQFLRQSNNGARERKGLKLRDGAPTAQDGDHFGFRNKKSRRHFR
jgi:hypothetical protein